LISFQEIVAEVSALEKQRDKLEAELKMVLPLSLSLSSLFCFVQRVHCHNFEIKFGFSSWKYESILTTDHQYLFSSCLLF
jgi:hypothetical protein